MKLPNLSYMMSVGELRYIQSTYEVPQFRNPDLAVGAFLSRAERLRCMLRGTLFRKRIRANPFYFYVLARTKYYDEVFLDAAYRPGACTSGRIINLGCGSDTRAYRFGHILKQKGIVVTECDQEEAIQAKQDLARRIWATDHVSYLAIDLNCRSWPVLEAILNENRPTLVLMEGVSPYVGEASFTSFLRMLAGRLCSGSVLAYDFKLLGVADSFGGVSSGERLFRLPADRQEVADFHRRLGFDVKHMELSSELSRRLNSPGSLQFDEDCLVQLVPMAPSLPGNSH